MWIEIGLAIAVPGIAAAIGVIRYFWKKEKCFITMKNKIDELSAHDTNANVDHDGYDLRLTEIEKNQQKWIIYLKLLLKDRNIPYDE